MVTRSSTVSRWLWHSTRALLVTILALAVSRRMPCRHYHPEHRPSALSFHPAVWPLTSPHQEQQCLFLEHWPWSSPSSWPPASTPLGRGGRWERRRWWSGYSSCLWLGWEKRTLTATQPAIHNVAAPAPHASPCPRLCFAFIKTLFPSVVYQTSSFHITLPSLHSIYVYVLYIQYSWFTMCYFLVYGKVIQLYIYIYIYSFSYLPSLWFITGYWI